MPKPAYRNEQVPKALRGITQKTAEVGLVGPVPARLPVGIMFFGRPFAEPMLFRIASAYEAATKHRAKRKLDRAQPQEKGHIQRRVVSPLRGSIRPGFQFHGLTPVANIVSPLRGWDI